MCSIQCHQEAGIRTRIKNTVVFKVIKTPNSHKFSLTLPTLLLDCFAFELPTGKIQVCKCSDLSKVDNCFPSPCFILHNDFNVGMSWCKAVGKYKVLE